MEHEKRAHAKLSASGAERWMNCPASPALEEMSGKDGSTAYAEEGTIAHEIAENELRRLLSASRGELSSHTDRCDEIGDAARGKGFDPGDIYEHVRPYVDFVNDEFNAMKLEGPAMLLIEEVVDLTAWVADGFGTCDAIIICDDVMHVIDLKFGKGVAVSAVNNKQLMLYALGALHRYGIAYGIETVKMTIHQPRLDSVSTFTISAEELTRWGETEVRQASDRACQPDAPTNAGKWCRFCKANPCASMRAEMVKIAQSDFAESGDKRTLTDEEVLELYKLVPIVEDFCEKIEAFVFSQALNGKKWDGLKLVEGRSVRKWVDEANAVAKLAEMGYSQSQALNAKIKGIGDVEKLVGKAVFKDKFSAYIDKPKGSPTLVPAEDKRAEISIDPAKDFN